jgi:hypothetical protein
LDEETCGEQPKLQHQKRFRECACSRFDVDCQNNILVQKINCSNFHFGGIAGTLNDSKRQADGKPSRRPEKNLIQMRECAASGQNRIIERDEGGVPSADLMLVVR